MLSSIIQNVKAIINLFIRGKSLSSILEVVGFRTVDFYTFLELNRGLMKMIGV